MEKHEFLTIQDHGFAEIREKASKFLGFAFPIESEAENNIRVEELWKFHPKASHVCYAYKLGLDDNQYRINDDGEPSGTAGKPIYGQILSKNLTDVGVYIVRYYGGTKLGASGLIAAYKDTAKLTLEECIIIQKSLNQCYDLSFSYDEMGKVLNDLKSLNINILEKLFEENVKVKIAVPLAEATLSIRKIKARLMDFSLDRVDDETNVTFCTFVKNQTIKL